MSWYQDTLYIKTESDIDLDKYNLDLVVANLLSDGYLKLKSYGIDTLFCYDSQEDFCEVAEYPTIDGPLEVERII